ncbi:hypothetical protein MRB53_018163 [Persea americana]|uniref:Uncharacterized protein n=1 Tax=Persea americana TaxID=3435 RepID=A0ACC2M712_PERAE|nr:hypothetical protein MRB53_018163 [Persea americana]
MDLGQEYSTLSSSSNNQSPSHVSSNDSTSSHVQSPNPPKRCAGRKKFRETRHPIYRGVRQRNGGKWVCEVREPYKKSRIWLGTFSCPDMAARAHDVAALALRGRAATLNFPDSAWLLPQAESSSPKDIQRAAAKVADVFRTIKPSSIIEMSKFTSSNGISEPEHEHAHHVFLDDEELFNMPGLLANMAEGLLIPPPTMQNEFNWDEVGCCHMDLSLWSEE